MTDFRKLKEILNDTFQTASQNKAELIMAQARDMNNVRDLAMVTTEALQHLHSGEVMQVRVNPLQKQSALTLTEFQRPDQEYESRTREFSGGSVEAAGKCGAPPTIERGTHRGSEGWPGLGRADEKCLRISGV